MHLRKVSVLLLLCGVSIRSNWLVFKFSIYLIFCVVGYPLLKVDSWTLNYFELFVAPFKSFSFCFIYIELCSVAQSCLTVTPWTAACQTSLSITNSQSLLKLMSIELVMPSNHLIFCHPFSCLQSFPALGSFPMGQFFTSGGQSIGVSTSASVLPMSNKDWFPLGWTCWISLQPKGLSRVFSNITIQKHQFFSTQLSL